jgi:hypothetical protein
MSDPKDSSDNVPFLADYLANLVPADDLEDHSDDVAPLPRFVEHIFPVMSEQNGLRQTKPFFSLVG